MSDNLLIITMIAIAALLIIALCCGSFVTQTHEKRLAVLEERKEELYNLPVNDEVEVR